MRNYYAKKGEVHDFSESDYFGGLTKWETMEDAADEAGCLMLSVPRTSRGDTSEKVILAFFASCTPPHITTASPLSRNWKCSRCICAWMKIPSGFQASVDARMVQRHPNISFLLICTNDSAAPRDTYYDDETAGSFSVHASDD